jgi:hypothetical protein
VRRGRWATRRGARFVKCHHFPAKSYVLICNDESPATPLRDKAVLGRPPTSSRRRPAPRRDSSMLPRQGRGACRYPRRAHAPSPGERADHPLRQVLRFHKNPPPPGDAACSSGLLRLGMAARWCHRVAFDLDRYDAFGRRLREGATPSSTARRSRCGRAAK